VGASGEDIGSDKASASYWPVAATEVIYGAATDVWGATLTPAVINSSNFGVRLSVFSNSLLTQAYVYWITVEVFYDVETSYKPPGTAANVDRDGKTVWSNPDYAKVDDANYAANEILKIDYSDWLRLTNFGFDGANGVPAGATIDGIEVQVRRAANGASVIFDSAVYLRKTAGQVGDNKTSGTFWATSKETVTYGGPTDTWNSGLTASDIRDSGFGIDLSAFNGDGSVAYDALIYFCQIRVYYTVVPKTMTKTMGYIIG
jgi:hypothetical protein